MEIVLKALNYNITDLGPLVFERYGHPQITINHCTLG